jgi:hypothetical protein
MIIKKSFTLTLAAGVWIAAVSLAGSLIYDLNRPLHDALYAGAPLSPLAAAMIAGGWLALISAVAWWGWQVPGALQLAYAPAKRRP